MTYPINSTLRVLMYPSLDTFKYVGVAILACEGAPTLLPVRDSM